MSAPSRPKQVRSIEVLAPQFQVRTADVANQSWLAGVADLVGKDCADVRNIFADHFNQRLQDGRLRLGLEINKKSSMARILNGCDTCEKGRGEVTFSPDSTGNSDFEALIEDPVDLELSATVLHLERVVLQGKEGFRGLTAVTLSGFITEPAAEQATLPGDLEFEDLRNEPLTKLLPADTCKSAKPITEDGKTGWRLVVALGI